MRKLCSLKELDGELCDLSFRRGGIDPLRWTQSLDGCSRDERKA